MIKKENESPKTEDQLVFINCSLEKNQLNKPLAVFLTLNDS